MATADLMLRGAAGALLAVVAVVLWRGARASWSGRLGAVLAVGAGAYLVCSAPAMPGWLDLPWLPVLVLCIANPVLFWLFARALFDDDYRPGWPEAAVLTAMIGAGLIRVYGQQAMPAWLDNGSMVAYQVVVLGLIAHAFWTALRGRAGDLIEARRRIRAVFVVGIGGYMAVIAVLEVALHGGAAPAWMVTLNPAAIALLAAAILIRVVRLRHDELVGVLLLPPKVAAPSSADEGLRRRLETEMVEGRAYCEEGLTIAALAERLGAPEYRLRRLINQELGFRNFPGFLNSYRLDEAKAALRDPARAREPILTIALGLGYGSIGPFNRAFKQTTGMTPSAYRRAPEV